MYYLIVILLFVNVYSYSQKNEKRFGIITFVSSQNFYAQFQSTEELQINDTVYLVSNSLLAGVIKFKSSNSIAVGIISKVGVGDSVFVFMKNSPTNKTEESFDRTFAETNLNQKTNLHNLQKNPVKSYSGKISFQFDGYSNRLKDFSRYKIKSRYSNNNFIMENLSLDFNVQLNINSQNQNFKKEIFKENFKIFQFYFAYQLNKNLNLGFGRLFNPLLRGLDAVDGFQLMMKDKKETYGIIAGSRPDVQNYWFNPKNAQAGLFYNRIDSINQMEMQNSFGFFEQTSNFKSDRRFIYFDHSNSFLPYTTAFFSVEIDFYNFTNQTIKNEINFTSINSSFNVRFNRKLSLNLSLNTRKNIFYMQDYRNQIDSILTNNFRDGFRISSSYFPIPEIRVSAHYNQSKARKGNVSSRNAGVVLFFNAPFLENSNFNLNYNNYNSAFLRGSSYSIMWSKNIFESFDISVNLKQFSFKAPNNSFISADLSIETGLLFNLFKSFNFFIIFDKNLRDKNFDYILLDLSYKI